MVSVAWVVKRQDTAEKTPGPSSARGVTVLPDAAAQAEKGPGVFSLSGPASGRRPASLSGRFQGIL